jgi:hypothetical protein
MHGSAQEATKIAGRVAAQKKGWSSAPRERASYDQPKITGRAGGTHLQVRSTAKKTIEE